MKNFILGNFVGGPVRGIGIEVEYFIVLSIEDRERRFVSIPKNPNISAVKPKTDMGLNRFEDRTFRLLFLSDLEGDADDCSGDDINLSRPASSGFNRCR